MILHGTSGSVTLKAGDAWVDLGPVDRVDVVDAAGQLRGHLAEFTPVAERIGPGLGGGIALMQSPLYAEVKAHYEAALQNKEAEVLRAQLAAFGETDALRFASSVRQVFGLLDTALTAFELSFLPPRGRAVGRRRVRGHGGRWPKLSRSRWDRPAWRQVLTGRQLQFAGRVTDWRLTGEREGEMTLAVRPDGARWGRWRK